MLYIRTGLMGHGKTLNTIKEVDVKAKSEGRTVYFHNVTDLDPSKLQADWFPFDEPHKWFDLPDNSIIVIDEAQGFFGVRDPRKEVPEYCSRFEIMRKQGHEVHLITQDPRFLDVHARRLCNKHIHYSRIFGSQKLVRYECERVYNDVEKLPGHKEADRSIITLDKNYFGVYTSAKAAHHFKFKPSKKAIFFLAATVATGWLVFRVYDKVYKGSDIEQVASEATQSIMDGKPPSFMSLVPDDQHQDKTTTAADYITTLQPRLPDLPHTAPIYDQIAQPKTFPRLFCVSTTDPQMLQRTTANTTEHNGKLAACTCYTQQATRYPTSFEFCMNAAQNGYFDHTLPDRPSRTFSNSGEQPFQPPQYQFNQSSFSQLEPPEFSVDVIPYNKGRFLW